MAEMAGGAWSEQNRGGDVLEEKGYGDQAKKLLAKTNCRGERKVKCSSLGR